MTTNVEIKRDKGFHRVSNNHWINVEVNECRIGKARIRISRKRLIINSISVFPEFERKGYAGKVIDIFKENYEEIVADRVRNTARGFWEKMDFHRDGYGNYIWKRGQQ